MAYMTDEEAERLDEFFTKNTITTVPDSLGPISRFKQSLPPGEVLSITCVIEDNEDELDGVFDDTKHFEEHEMATAATA
jgi:hypothetical protein